MNNNLHFFSLYAIIYFSPMSRVTTFSSSAVAPAPLSKFGTPSGPLVEMFVKTAVWVLTFTVLKWQWYGVIFDWIIDILSLCLYYSIQKLLQTKWGKNQFKESEFDFKKYRWDSKMHLNVFFGGERVLIEESVFVYQARRREDVTTLLTAWAQTLYWVAIVTDVTCGLGCILLAKTSVATISIKHWTVGPHPENKQVERYRCIY